MAFALIYAPLMAAVAVQTTVKLDGERGLQGKLATLDNALTAYARFDLERHDAVALMARIVNKVLQWRGFFEEHDAPGALIDRVTSAFRQLDEVASEGLAKELGTAL